MDEKLNSIKALMKQIEKRFGMGALMRLGEKTKLKIECISTGNISLDLALGVCGIPKGRIIEIFGPESSGKTTLALHIVAESQKNGGICGFIDVEHALDATYAEKIGVDLKNLLVSQPDAGEEALEIAHDLIKSGEIETVVVDSVAALIPRQEIDGEIGNLQIGLQARLMSQALRKLTSITSKTNSIVIFINQLRDKIGSSYGSSETTPGGRALKFYSSVRLDVRRTGKLEDNDGRYGNKVKVKIVKNKVAPPFKEVEFEIIYGKGISKSASVLDCAIFFDIIKQSGSWYSYNDEKLGQGRETVKTMLENNVNLLETLQKQIMGKAGILEENGDVNEPKN